MPARAATDITFSQATDRNFSWGDVFNNSGEFAAEIMETKKTAGEVADIDFCHSSEKLSTEDESEQGSPPSSPTEKPKLAPRRPFVSQASQREVDRVFHSEDFDTSAAGDPTRPAWWQQWVDTCRQQKHDLCDSLFISTRSEGASEDTKQSEQDLKDAFKKSCVWQDLVPKLHKHYSELYSKLGPRKEDQEQSCTLHLFTTSPAEVHPGLKGPIMVIFTLGARSGQETELPSAQDETGVSDDAGNKVSTEFFGVKNGLDEDWKWEVTML